MSCAALRRSSGSGTTPSRRCGHGGAAAARRAALLGAAPSRQGTRVAAASTEGRRKFADFLQFEEPGSDEEPPSAQIGSDRAADLVERADSLLVAAREALEAVRQRDPADSRNRRHGKGIRSTTTAIVSSADEKPSGSGGSRGRDASARGLTTFIWESDLEDGGGYEASSSSAYNGSRDYAAPSPGAAAMNGYAAGGSGGWEGGTGGAGGTSGTQSWAQSGFDSWFGDKVDTGPLQLRRSMQPMAQQAVQQVAVLERPIGPATLEFAPPDAPQPPPPSIFPAELQLHFQAPETEAAQPPPAQEAAAVAVPTDTEGAAAEAAAQAEAAPPDAAPEGNWERRSGEEVGPHGYWYRWTEVRGCDDSGEVQWYEKWWEASDWRGMKEMGAEKWGCNARGDAWRETWREAIVTDSLNINQPSVERSAHKWAKSNVTGNEWEEKWGERYMLAGRAEKWADKWGREGAEVWHEKWGENYDGAGGCVKWTDKWAEREVPGGAREQWGDKWEENFKGGRGTKQGETWNVSAGGERYNRWWGENHLGDRLVQKFGSSSTGEHWDVTEQMDTYYNPIPHFGYDLALAHSPQLRNVPMLPRDRGTLDRGMGSIL